MKRELIIDTVKQLVCDFLYYDRKEDEELNRKELIECIETEITVDKIVETFRNELIKELKNEDRVYGTIEAVFLLSRCRLLLSAEAIPLNPFRVFDYFLGERIDRQTL